jgi:hypothetical protein
MPKEASDMKASAGSKHSSPAWLGLLAVVLVLSCGKSESPSGPNPPVDEGPNPDGVLLSGDAAGNALDAIRTLLPWSAAGTEIQDDGFVMTRLTVVIAPDATVGQVNVLLQSHDLRIICMRKDMPIVSIKTAALADTLAANDLIQVLLADPAIAFAFRYYAAQSDPVAVAPDAASATKTTPGGSANSELSPLKAMKMPAAWNVRGLVTGAQKTRVMVPDSYRRLTPHPEITAQRFVTGAGHTDRLIKASPDDPGVQVGNHGFHVSGIIGADWDASGATGACPDAQQHLDLLSFPMGSLNLHDLSVSLEHEINASFPSGKFVLNTSLGYNDPAFTFVPKALRAWDMLLWRAVGVQIQDRCLHLTSAGNAGTTSGDGGLASFNSPYTAASRFDDPLEMIAGVNLTEVQRTTLTGLVNRIVAADPRLLSRLTNTPDRGRLGIQAGLRRHESRTRHSHGRARRRGDSRHRSRQGRHHREP